MRPITVLGQGFLSRSKQVSFIFMIHVYATTRWYCALCICLHYFILIEAKQLCVRFRCERQYHLDVSTKYTCSRSGLESQSQRQFVVWNGSGCHFGWDVSVDGFFPLWSFERKYERKKDFVRSFTFHQFHLLTVFFWRMNEKSHCIVLFNASKQNIDLFRY